MTIPRRVKTAARRFVGVTGTVHPPHHPPRPTVPTSPIPDVDTAVAQVEGMDPECWWELGPKLTCTEAEALTQLLATVGAVTAAEALLEAHAASDGDTHPHLGCT